jgi:hypothetical protein
MLTADQVHNELFKIIGRLPLEKKMEVLDFADFLGSKNGSNGDIEKDEFNENLQKFDDLFKQNEKYDIKVDPALDLSEMANEVNDEVL